MYIQIDGSSQVFPFLYSLDLGSTSYSCFFLKAFAFLFLISLVTSLCCFEISLFLSSLDFCANQLCSFCLQVILLSGIAVSACRGRFSLAWVHRLLMVIFRLVRPCWLTGCCAFLSLPIVLYLEAAFTFFWVFRSI
jgi:hypothetical protein